MSAPERIGYVSALGYLYCASCHPWETSAADWPVHADSAPHNVERCDSCREPLMLAALAASMRVNRA